MAGRSKWIIQTLPTSDRCPESHEITSSHSLRRANAIRRRYIRSTIPLDDLERRARYPFVDANGYESKAVSHVRNS